MTWGHLQVLSSKCTELERCGERIPTEWGWQRKGLNNRLHSKLEGDEGPTAHFAAMDSELSSLIQDCYLIIPTSEDDFTIYPHSHYKSLEIPKTSELEREGGLVGKAFNTYNVMRRSNNGFYRNRGVLFPTAK